MGARPLVLLAGAQLAIGAAAIFARFALVAAGPLAVSSLRLGIAAVPVALLALVRQRYRVLDRGTELRLGLAGLVLGLHFGSWIASLQHASVAVSTLLVCSTPVFTESWTILRTRVVRPAALASIVVAALGLAVVVGVPSRAEQPLGIGLALLGALAMAAYLLLVRASDPRYTTLAVIARTYPIAALALGVGALVAGQGPPPPTALGAWGGILAMALISQLFGHTALNAAVRSVSATLVSTTTLLEPVIAAVAAALIFGERLGPFTLLGAALIFAGIGLAVRAERASDSDDRGGASTSSA
jgi:drug/metabolite transporter (DMT)-like permease